MGQQIRFKTKIGQIPVIPGSQPLLDIPRQHDYESIFLRLSGVVQVTSVAAVRYEAPVQAVPRIELTSEGRNTHFNAPFWRGSIGNYERPWGVGNLLGSTEFVQPTSGALGSYPFRASAVIDLCNVDGVRPKDSNLRTLNMSLFQLRPTFGQPGDMFFGGAAAYVGIPLLEVFGITMYEVPGENYSTPGVLKKTTYQEIAVPTSNTTQEIRLPAGNVLKAVVVRAEGLAVQGEPSNSIINNMILQSAQDVRVNYTGPMVRALNQMDYGSLAAGYYVLDMTSQGRTQSNLTDGWNCQGQAEPKLVLDIVGGANVRLQVCTTEMIFATPI